jgi:hypothetical protein
MDFNLGNPKVILLVQPFHYKYILSGALPFASMHFYWLTALHAPITTQKGIVVQG